LVEAIFEDANDAATMPNSHLQMSAKPFPVSYGSQLSDTTGMEKSEEGQYVV